MAQRRLKQNFNEVQAILDAVGQKVDKIEGKGLSANDYTDQDKDKLASVEEDAQENVIEVIESDGVELPIENKTVRIPAHKQSDWSQNDSSGKDYIKNRTHWEENGVVHKLHPKFLDMDTAPTSGSTKPVTSGGAKEALDGKQDMISDLADIRHGAGLGETAYQKPSAGIPAPDLAAGVIPDVSGFITRTVNDLANYYLKSETYTKEEVAALIGAIKQFHYEVYAALPATGEGNVLYLIGPTGSGSDKYEEYVYVNSTWTKIGDTSIDLSNYVTTTALNTALADYTTTANLTTLLAGKQDALVSGTNIKTINGESLLGSGDIEVAAESIDTVEVSVDSNTGTPSASAAISGSTLTLAFHNIKGETGATGATGPQGEQGNTGSSVDYPYELVNNLTTDDATKGLSAAQGVVLDRKISQLGQKVDEFAQGKFYGYFSNAEDLPTEERETGFAYVGADAPFAVYNYNGTEWVDSGVTIDRIPAGNGEDIDYNAEGLLQFADRNYDAQNPGGMGYVILRKDKTFAEQVPVTSTNIIYEVRYDFSVPKDFILAYDCELRFVGGKISGSGNNKLHLRRTLLSGDVCFEDIVLDGTMLNDSVKPEWFGAAPTSAMSSFDSTAAIQSAVIAGQNIGKPIEMAGSTYLISSPISIVYKAVTINGRGATLTTNNAALAAFISISGNNLRLFGVKINNLRFTNIAGCKAKGILFDNAMVVNCGLSWLYFASFESPCIYLKSTQGSGYGGAGVYAHNIAWEHIYVSSSSSIIGQERGSTRQPYIYGGVIDDVHFEGTHKDDTNPFIMDLYGFRNCEITNTIIEGITQGQKTGVINLCEQCRFKDFYVEFGTGSLIPTYSFYCDMRMNSEVEIDGYYGALPAPMYLQKCSVRFVSSNGTNLNAFQTFGIANIVSSNSAEYKISVGGISLGTSWSNTNNNRRFIPGIDYHGGVWIDAHASLLVDDSEPFLLADLTRLTLGGSSQSLYKNGLFIWQKAAGNCSLTFGEDKYFGNTAILESLAADKFLNAGVYFDKTQFASIFGDAPDNGFTAVITFRALATPANGDVDSGGVITPGASDNKYYASSSFCIGPKLKEKDTPHTAIFCGSTLNTGSYQIMRFDSSVTGEVVDEVQKYEILEIAFFKGRRLGKCKSRILIQ